MVMRESQGGSLSYSLGSCAQVAHPADQLECVRLAMPDLPPQSSDSQVPTSCPSVRFYESSALGGLDRCARRLEKRASELLS